MLLTVNDLIVFPPATGEPLEIDHVVLAGSPSFKAEATVSTGYTDVTSIANWDLYGRATSGYAAFRQMLIDDFIGDWGALTTVEQKTLVLHYLWPDGTSDAELDTLWTDAERDQFHDDVWGALKASEPKRHGVIPNLGARLEYPAEIKIVEGDKPITQDATWQHLGGVTADLSVKTEVLVNAFGRFSGDYKTVIGGGGEKAQLRIREDDGVSNVTLRTISLPDTSDVWKRDASVDTNVVFRVGRNRYTLEGRLNGAVSASVRDGLFALIEMFG